MMEGCQRLKRETFLYWCVHGFILLVMILPTIVFVLRVNHPVHEEDVNLNHTKERQHAGENKTCVHPLAQDENATCRIPCDWSLMRSSLRDTFYAVMVLNLWAALIATVITVGTLASFKQMRTFPHIVRFYILICSALYATASLLPLRIGLSKYYCGKDKFWHQDGHTTTPTVVEGASTHYFFLGFCFWSLCYVANTHSVIVRHAQHVFVHKTRHHAIQFAACAFVPALLVGINMAVKQPGYMLLYLDRMTSVFTSPVLEYLTLTLPIQISLGVAVSLLWSIIRFVRKVRKNQSSFQAIRSEDDIRGFLNAERQFTKLAVVFILTVTIVLSSEMYITYKNEEYLHEAEEYFHCLKVSADCIKPEVQIFFLSGIKIIGPGFYCLLNFFLLFFNKETRGVWRSWLRVCWKVLTCRWAWTGKKDTTDSVNAGSRGQTFEKQAFRARSCTMESNASMDTSNRISTKAVSKPTFESLNSKTPNVEIPLVHQKNIDP